MKTRTFFDTETTGLMKPSPAGIDRQPYITELFMAKLSAGYEVIEEYEQRFSIPVPVPDFITKITGISDKDLLGCPRFADESEKIRKFLESSDETVAHNHAFDKAMVMNEFIRAGYKKFNWPISEVCTVQMSMSLEQRRINLQRLHELVTGTGFPDAHTAKGDVYAMIRCHHAMHEKGML